MDFILSYGTKGTKQLSIEKVLTVKHGLYIKLQYNGNKAAIHIEKVLPVTQGLYIKLGYNGNKADIH